MADMIDLENEVNDTAPEQPEAENLEMDDTVAIVDLDSLGSTGGRGGKLSPQAEAAEVKILPVVKQCLADGQARKVNVEFTTTGATAAKAFKAFRKTVYRVFFRNDYRSDDVTYRLFVLGDLQSPLTAAKAEQMEDGRFRITGATVVVIPVK